MVGEKHGQLSMEFMVLLAMGLLTATIAILLATEQINSINALKEQNDARNTVMDLGTAAKEVYAQGEGSRKHVFIRLPSNYDPDSSGVLNQSIWVKAGENDHLSLVDFIVRGRLPTTSGAHWVWVTSEGTWVRIGDPLLEVDKNRIYVVMERNSTASQAFSVRNTWIRDIDVSTATSWTTSEVNMTGIPSSFSLSLNDSTSINVQFSSSPTSSGIYQGEIQLDADDGVGNDDIAIVLVTVFVTTPGQTPPMDDLMGPIITNIYQDRVPAPKLEPLTILVEASDALTGNNTITECQIDADNEDNWELMAPVDGVYDQSIETAKYNYTSGFDLGAHFIRAFCTDSVGNLGPIAYYYFDVSEADQLGPIVINMNHTEYPTTLSNITLAATATDIYTGDSDIQGCRVRIDSGNWSNVTPDDGVWDSPTEMYTHRVGTLLVGYHTASHQCTDSVGNVGDIYNDTFKIVDVDLMLVLDKSGSMLWNVTNAKANSTVSAASTGWSWVKNLTVNEKNGDMATLVTELRGTFFGCTVFYRATINGMEVATGSYSSTAYGRVYDTINVSAFEPPYEVALWLSRDSAFCTAYNAVFTLQQPPMKMDVTKDSAKTFLDVAGNNLQAGLVSFSTAASTDKTLAMMTTPNQIALKNAIDAIAPAGWTCLECGLVNAANELVSSRARPGATKVIIFLTDGKANDGDSIQGAVYCRDRNITVYTIGFGSDADAVELTNIALLTRGDYYYAPNAATLMQIFRNLGKD